MTSGVAARTALPTVRPGGRTGSPHRTRPTSSARGPPAGGHRVRCVARPDPQGDEAALATLYDQASDRIYGLLLRMVNSPEQAAAMTHEVFVDVWRQARRYDPSGGMVFSWIVAFAHERGMNCLAAMAGESAAEPGPDPGNVSRQIDEVWAVIEQRFGRARVRAEPVGQPPPPDLRASLLAAIRDVPQLPPDDEQGPDSEPDRN